jgi:amino acid transporter
MEPQNRQSFGKKLKQAVIGKARSPLDRNVFQHLSLIAFFAWVGLGADGLSSSCYGPEEAFLALHGHAYLSIFVALASALTVLIISASYSQIIELFPSGGGGYLVASKLLSSRVGLVSGCALLIDYVLTITISIAAGADAVFSFLPSEWHVHKLTFAVFGILLMTLLNLRGVKESVMPLVPVFLIFVLTHFFAVVYAVLTHATVFPEVVHSTVADIHNTRAQIGIFAMIALILRAYSMGAGTFTGIEAVSNGLPILREPKVKTGKHTMLYMSLSLAFTVMGLMVGYLLFKVEPQAGKTLNAVLFESMTQGWGLHGRIFVWVTLFSEAFLLLIAAQTGFLGGPRVLANMAADRWFPTRFAILSDRLVAQNGILLMGGAGLLTMILTKGSVRYLVVLYSINVFITFCLSQAGMVRHWCKSRSSTPHWRAKLLVNGTGLLATSFILVSVIVLKFTEGGWITLFITGGLVALAIVIKRHYFSTVKLLGRLNDLLPEAAALTPRSAEKCTEYNSKAKTAIILVNGFNGLGLHTLFNVIRFFGGEFKNFVFVQVGVVDAGNFKGADEITNLKTTVQRDVDRYAAFMQGQGFYGEGLSFIGTDVVSETEKIVPVILERFPSAVFFGGQLVFPKETFWTKWLHNYTVFTMQRRFYQEGIPFVILPIRV